MSPIIRQPLANQTVVLGDNATFTCEVISGNFYHLFWIKNQIINGSIHDEYGTPYATVMPVSTYLILDTIL